MSKKLARVVIVGSVLGLAVLGASEAVAGWRYAIPIGACKQVTTTGVLEYWWDGFFNGSTTQKMNIECSLPSAPDYPYTNGLNFWAVDNNSGANQDVVCNLKVVTISGLINYTGPTRKSTNVVGAYNSGWVFPEVGGQPYLSCLFPAATGGGTARSGIQGITFGDDQ